MASLPRASTRFFVPPRHAARVALSNDARSKDSQLGARRLSSQAWVPFEQPEGGSIVSSLLPKELQSPQILTHALDNGLKICVGASASLGLDRPGNGGFRLLEYPSKQALETECVGLAQVNRQSRLSPRHPPYQ